MKNEKHEFILNLAKIIALVIVAICFFAFSSCGVYHKTAVSKDSTAVEKKNTIQSTTTDIGFDSLHSVLYLSGTEYRLKPGVQFSGSFADREKWLMNNSNTIIIYQAGKVSGEIKKDTTHTQINKDNSIKKVEVKNKNVVKSADTSFHIPGYAWILFIFIFGVLGFVYLESHRPTINLKDLKMDNPPLPPLPPPAPKPKS